MMSMYQPRGCGAALVHVFGNRFSGELTSLLGCEPAMRFLSAGLTAQDPRFNKQIPNVLG